jgi:hypothetical protein
MGFLVYELNCQEKKIGTITKESRKIGASYKNYNFCMHSRSQLTIGTIYLINSFFLFDMPRDGNNSIECFQ